MMSKLILPTPLSDKNFNYFKFLISNLTSLWKTEISIEGKCLFTHGFHGKLEKEDI